MINILKSIAEFMAAFKPGFSSVYSIWGTVVSVLLVYKTVYVLIGALCTRKFAPAKKQHKYGIVIAARNEKLVIGNLLDSIKKQDYPADKITVFVVADNCTDDGETARIARDHGAIVYERFDKEHATKGFALQFLFQNIEKDYGTQSFEGFFVFDADNLLKSDYISRMNDAFDSGEKIITSFRNSKNIDENWVAASYAIHWLRSSRTAHRARSVLRLATNIQGTGFLFASEIVKDGWKYTSLTEDRALTADAVVQGYQISYNDAAEFYDEQPTQIKIALRQRIRWAKGHIMAFGESGFGLFKNIFTYKGKNLLDTIRQRFACYDMFILVLPRPLLVIAKKILKAIVFLTAYSVSGNFRKLTISYFGLIVIYKIKDYVKQMRTAVYIFVFDNKRIKKISLWNKIKFTLTWPLFDIIGKISMYVALFKKVQWKPIPHGSSVTIDDVTKPRDVHIPKFLKRAGENGMMRFVAHAAFAGLTLAYSFSLLTFGVKIFLVFIIGNLMLIGLHFASGLNEKTPRWVSLVLLCLTFVWNITLCCEILGNGAITYLFSMRLILNLLLYSTPYILVFALSNSVIASTIAASVFWFFTSSINFFLTAARGRPLFISDLFAIGTAINVAGQYELNISAFYIFTLVYIASMLLYFGILKKSRGADYYKIKWQARYPVNMSLLVIICLMMSSSSFLSSMGVTPYFWSHKVNGFPLNFIMDLQYSKIEKPKGYTADAVKSLYEQNKSDAVSLNAYDGTDRPNVIVIMDESFSDLRVIGDFDTNIDVMPFIDSLCADPSVISGYTYVSVFGGGTADSEYELLTGDNMFIYSQGAIPYQTNFKNLSSLPTVVSTFNEMGYKTIATHPYLSSGWNRPNVYRIMGFDVQEYIEAYEGASYYRAYVNDESDFDHLIKLYEEKDENEPLFIFNITMQNHGGYKTSYKNFDQKVVLRNTRKKYPQAEQYLSLLHETDRAVEKLITYFEDADEPTVILFFGDHQVQIENDFYEELYGKSLDTLTEAELMQKYATRFFIWSNYDLNTPTGYSALTELQGNIYSKLNADKLPTPTPEPTLAQSDSANSDATASDTALADDTETASSVFTPQTADKVSAKNGKHETVYKPETDITDSDITGSDIASSDIIGSDIATSDVLQSSDTTTSDATEEKETFVTQTRVEYPQITTNISFLSSLLFEASGLPETPYMRFVKVLREKFPVITVFGIFDAEGEYYPMGKADGTIREKLRTYEYAIYNHLFDSDAKIRPFFSLQDGDVTINGNACDKFGYTLMHWFDEAITAENWVFDMVITMKNFMDN